MAIGRRNPRRAVPVMVAAEALAEDVGVGRAIGDSSQFTGSHRPGDPQLIFGLYGPEKM